MRRDIRPIPIVARIPHQIDAPAQHRDVPLRRHDPGPGIDVVLRAEVDEPQRPGREPRDRVVGMRDAEVPAPVLVRDVVAQGGRRDARRAVGVEVGRGGGGGVSDLGGGDGGDGAAEAVADDDDAVSGVSGRGGFEGGEDAGAGFEPAVVAVHHGRWGFFSFFFFFVFFFFGRR